MLKITQIGTEVHKSVLRSDRRRKDREGHITSDRFQPDYIILLQGRTRNHVLTNRMQLGNKNPLSYGKFAKCLKDNESEIRGNLQSFHWRNCDRLVQWKDKLFWCWLFIYLFVSWSLRLPLVTKPLNRESTHPSAAKAQLSISRLQYMVCPFFCSDYLM